MKGEVYKVPFKRNTTVLKPVLYCPPHHRNDRGVYFPKIWYFCPLPLFFQNDIFFPRTVKISPFPPFFIHFPFKFTLFLYESSYFFPNQPIIHIFIIKNIHQKWWRHFSVSTLRLLEIGLVWLVLTCKTINLLTILCNPLFVEWYVIFFMGFTLLSWIASMTTFPNYVGDGLK